MNDSDRRLSVEKKLWICGGQFSSSFCTCVMICGVDMGKSRYRFREGNLDKMGNPSIPETNGIVFPNVCVCVCVHKQDSGPQGAPLTCMVPTKMLTDMKPCDLETFTSAGARKIATRNPTE